MKYVVFIALLLGSPWLGLAQDYVSEINEHRDKQRHSLEHSAGGPILAENLRFVSYFPPNEKFRVVATAEFLENEPKFRMPTSDGTSKEFRRFALLHFTLEGEMFTLPVYENVSLFQNAIQSSYLFLPFLDNTSGESTYESGRYIDIRRQDFVHGKVTIDFNKAYNPYCAYSSGYRCPQPPKENFLDIAIEAGERKYTGPKHQREQDSNMAKNFTEKEKNLILAGHAEEKMYVLQITNEEDSIILRTQSDDIKHNDPLLQVLSGRMLATVRDPEHPGVGIAAPQVGINKNVIWVQRFDKEGQPFEFYINPRIIWRSKLLRKGSEGCLSIPDRKEDVIRNYSIKLQYTDQTTGKSQEELIEGFTAVIFQHEVDHLYGILYPDRLEEQSENDIIMLNDRLEFYLKKGTVLP